ncbi:MAG TPA: sulfatase [Planctomycetota bacterium]|nr:sulfatase [Planctomycetota bacterium]
MLFAGCARERERPPDLVLVVLDTLRVDQTSLEGGPAATPFLESFAAGGTRFTKAYSTSCWTLPAHASMFTGALPDTHGADQMRSRVLGELPLLAERLAAAGYQTAGFTRNPWISERTGLQRGFESFHELWPIPGQPDVRDGRHRVLVDLERWLPQERDPSRPLFLFVNLIKAHAPYRPNERWAANHFEEDELWREAMERWSTGPRDLIDRVYGHSDPLDAAEQAEVRALYAAGVEHTDDIVRRVFELVDAACDPAHTLALIVSDHGENLGDRGHVSHMFELNEALTHVLCLARGPGFAAGAVDPRPVQLQDVSATFLEAAGLPGATPVSRDLAGPADLERVLLSRIAWPRTWLGNFPPELRADPQFTPLLRELWAAQDQRYKLVVEQDGSERLYDLSLQRVDGDEVEVEVSSVPEARLARLRDAVAASRARGELLQDVGEEMLDHEQLEALRALGYAR